jgi:hypothetical protein
MTKASLKDSPVLDHYSPEAGELPPYTDVPQILQKRGRGRPKKKELQAIKKNEIQNKGAVSKARLEEFKTRLIATGGERILDRMIQIALDDNHPGQMSAMKMAIDRILPASMFDAAKGSNSAPAISINISGLTAPTVQAEEVQYDISDVEIKE